MNDMYEPLLRCENKSIFTGGESIVSEIASDDPDLPDVVKAFVADNDIQELRVVSTNYGFIKTFSKQFKRVEKPPLGVPQEKGLTGTR